MGRPDHPNSFGRDRRVRKRRDFLRIQSSRQRVVTPHFVMLLAPSPEPARARLGLVVSKKVGCAAQRNRVKRCCREAFRAAPELLPDGVDLVLIARVGADELGTAGVSRELRSVSRLLWGRAQAALKAASEGKTKGGASGRDDT